MRNLMAATLAGSCLAAQVSASAPLPAPLSSALDAGATVSGVAAEGKASTHPILVRKGDALVMSLRGAGRVELAVHGPDGARVTRSTGQDMVGMRWSFQDEGTHVIAVLAEPGTRYSLQLQREGAAPVRPGVDPRWGVYSRLAGKRAEFEGAAYIEWTWDLPGEALVERQYRPEGSLLYTACIIRGVSAPNLTLVAADLAWVGDVSQADGSVTWRFGAGSSGHARTELMTADTLLMTVVDGIERTSLGKLGPQQGPPADSKGVCPRARAPG